MSSRAVPSIPAAPESPAPSGTAAAPSLAAEQPIKSEALFGGALELQIDHRGVLYRLRQTALGKLILTK